MAKKENSTTSSYSSFAKIQPSNDADADPDPYALEKFKLYETRAVRYNDLEKLKSLDWVSWLCSYYMFGAEVLSDWEW